MLYICLRFLEVTPRRYKQEVYSVCEASYWETCKLYFEILLTANLFIKSRHPVGIILSVKIFHAKVSTALNKSNTYRECAFVSFYSYIT